MVHTHPAVFLDFSATTVFPFSVTRTETAKQALRVYSTEDMLSC